MPLFRLIKLGLLSGIAAISLVMLYLNIHFDHSFHKMDDPLVLSPTDVKPCACSRDEAIRDRKYLIELTNPWHPFDSDHWFHIGEYYLPWHGLIEDMIPPNATIYVASYQDKFVKYLTPMTFFLLLLAFTDGTANSVHILPPLPPYEAYRHRKGSLVMLDRVEMEYVYDSSKPVGSRFSRHTYGRVRGTSSESGSTTGMGSRGLGGVSSVGTVNTVRGVPLPPHVATKPDSRNKSILPNLYRNTIQNQNRSFDSALWQRDNSSIMGSGSPPSNNPGSGNTRTPTSTSKLNERGSGAGRGNDHGNGNGNDHDHDYTTSNAAYTKYVRVQSGTLHRPSKLTLVLPPPCICAVYLGQFGSAPVDRGHWFKRGYKDVTDMKRKIDQICKATTTAKSPPLSIDTKAGEATAGSGSGLPSPLDGAFPVGIGQRQQQQQHSTRQQGAQIGPAQPTTAAASSISVPAAVTGRMEGTAIQTQTQAKAMTRTHYRMVVYQRDLYRRLVNADKLVETIQTSLNQQHQHQRQQHRRGTRYPGKQASGDSSGTGGTGGTGGLPWVVDLLVHDNHRAPEDLLAWFGDVDVVVTPHGFQTMVMLFMPKHSLIVEIFPYKYWKVGYAPLARELALEHEWIQQQSPSVSVHWQKRLYLFFVSQDACMRSIYCRDLARNVDISLSGEEIDTVVLAAKRNVMVRNLGIQ